MPESGNREVSLYETAMPEISKSVISEKDLEQFLAQSGLIQVVEEREKLKKEQAGIVGEMRRLFREKPHTLEAHKTFIEQHNKDLERIGRDLDRLNKIIERKMDTYDASFERTGKLLFDWYKHLTTLSTASILIISALLQRLYTDSTWNGLVVAALLLLLGSIVPLVFSMLGIIDKFASHPEPKPSSDEEFAAYRNVTTVGWLSFLLGIVAFIIFVIRNSVFC